MYRGAAKLSGSIEVEFRLPRGGGGQASASSGAQRSDATANYQSASWDMTDTVHMPCHNDCLLLLACNITILPLYTMLTKLTVSNWNLSLTVKLPKPTVKVET